MKEEKDEVTNGELNELRVRDGLSESESENENENGREREMTDGTSTEHKDDDHLIIHRHTRPQKLNHLIKRASIMDVLFY